MGVPLGVKIWLLMLGCLHVVLGVRVGYLRPGTKPKVDPEKGQFLEGNRIGRSWVRGVDGNARYRVYLEGWFDDKENVKVLYASSPGFGSIFHDFKVHVSPWLSRLDIVEGLHWEDRNTRKVSQAILLQALWEYAGMDIRHLQSVQINLADLKTADQAKITDIRSILGGGPESNGEFMLSAPWDSYWSPGDRTSFSPEEKVAAWDIFMGSEIGQTISKLAQAAEKRIERGMFTSSHAILSFDECPPGPSGLLERCLKELRMGPAGKRAGKRRLA